MNNSVILVIIIFSLPSCRQNKELDILDIEIPHQVDSRMLITSENEIVYSSNVSGKYQLYKFVDNHIELNEAQGKDVFNPFLIKGEISGIYDNDGDEANHVAASDDEINGHIKSGSNVGFIQSSACGDFVIFGLKNDSHVYLIDLVRNEKIVIADVKSRFHAVSFSKAETVAVISLDSVLIRFDLKNRTITQLATDLAGEKLNPFVYGDNVYFVNNSESEFYAIYRIDLSKEDRRPKLILSGSSDLRMPKFDGASLFFIEIIRSEYLLSRYDSERQNIEHLTRDGVVYSYEFVGSDSIVMTYSDFFSPRCIRVYSKSRDLFFDSKCDSVNLNLSYQIVKQDDIPAYVLRPHNEVPLKGVVLFLHPGLHSDFSPRWDDIIMAICANGFLLVAPNFPMSSGYGKSYTNRSFEDACVSIERWRHHILSTYNLPLYLLASSSGNILMEAAISRNPKQISAAASLFGIRSNFPINPKFPILYILGENDPFVDFTARKAELMNLESDNREIRVISYQDEGHWFRNAKNIRDVQRTIVFFFLEQL